MEKTETIHSILADQIGCDVADLVPEKTLRELGYDSLDAVELLIAYEEEFDIEIDESEFHERSSVADVIACVEKLTADRGDEAAYINQAVRDLNI